MPPVLFNFQNNRRQDRNVLVEKGYGNLVLAFWDTYIHGI